MKFLKVLSILMLVAPVYASDTAATAAVPVQQQSPFADMMTTLIVVCTIFFLFVIRPHSKNIKARQQLAASLKAGDTIVLSSGIIGTFQSLVDGIVTIEIARGTTVRVEVGHIDHKVG